MTRTARFLPGKTLPDALGAAMKRINAYGVIYPDGYHQVLVEKYSHGGVRYPHILMIIGEPRIHRHFFYPHVIGKAGRLLDYGCGTADNVRQLIRDGFPREQITAFDINRESIDLGIDLYRDREQMEDLFVVSEKFPFGIEEFDIVYSASVIHVIADETEFNNYLANAHSALRPGGVLFGSTLGLVDGVVRSPGNRGPPRLMTKKQLADSLAGTEFSRPDIVTRGGVPEYVPHHENICVFEFYTKKQTL
ncbi:class I SAM-dependent methyltransferase [uncultured Methanoregula sp.]|uniref:class I SAM-dependent methyltransferase n=1 Tax=uncultured Methanoregula sp. TaxID=1005933 RepID=UPI002AAAB80B|nr:class I SAM-dependent methyltransferase [uncultured Methanoregula sp.]